MSYTKRWRRWLRKIPRKPKSRVLWRSGRAILKGGDMSEFRRRIYERAEGRCEIVRDGARCDRPAAWDGWQHGELYHEVHRARGGSDSESNCKWACFDCHRARHPGPQFAPQRRGSLGAETLAADPEAGANVDHGRV